MSEAQLPITRAEAKGLKTVRHESLSLRKMLCKLERRRRLVDSNNILNQDRVIIAAWQRLRSIIQPKPFHDFSLQAQTDHLHAFDMVAEHVFNHSVVHATKISKHV